MSGTLRVPDERESLAEDARNMQRLTPAERVELFCSIMQMVQVVWATLPSEERLRRLRIGEEVEPGPRPWLARTAAGWGAMSGAIDMPAAVNARLASVRRH